jgi:hypothetical protein
LTPLVREFGPQNKQTSAHEDSLAGICFKRDLLVRPCAHGRSVWQKRGKRVGLDTN